MYADAKRILGKGKVQKELGLLNPLLESGVNVCFGSDIPGTDVGEAASMFQFQAAVMGRAPCSTTTPVPPAIRLPTLAQRVVGTSGEAASRSGPVSSNVRWRECITEESAMSAVDPKWSSRV